MRMAIGKRTQERLDQLGWKPIQLWEKINDSIPEGETHVSPQAIYNIIKRDSIRSELDTKIALRQTKARSLHFLRFSDPSVVPFQPRRPWRGFILYKISTPVDIVKHLFNNYLNRQNPRAGHGPQ